MKQVFALAVLFSMAACSPTEPTTLVSTSNNQALKSKTDSVAYAQLTFVADQKNNMPMMLGSWLVHTMQRQSALPEESLYIPLQLNEDQTFTVSTPCGEMKGTYTIKGVSIKFKDAGFNHSNCTSTEKLDEMVRLLTKSVSLYAYNGNMLFLKDNSGNNVFRATR